MPEVFEIEKILIPVYRIPSITAYNRLEISPRTEDFERSLRAEVRDPLWMLTRQWQFGEFQGEDAASPVTAQILGEHTVMDTLTTGKTSFNYNDSIPIETSIERENLAGSLSLAISMGRYFLKLMKEENLHSHLPDFILRYLPDYKFFDNDQEGHQLAAFVKDKIFDGFLVYLDVIKIEGTVSRFEQWITTLGLTSTKHDQFKNIADKFKSWYQRNYSQPSNEIDSAWLPSQLEYGFSAHSSTRTSAKIVADQYPGNHLDWFSFDLKRNSERSAGSAPPDDIENLVSFIPSPVSFKGMPHPRFWTMEEGQTDFGNISTSPTGLLHLMLAEFGLIYSNDWFMLPYPLSINTVCELKGIVITDTFGQHILVRPAGWGTENNWQRWAMFHHTDLDDRLINTNVFYLPPSVNKVLEAPPLEQVNFLRDEMANLVWAVEDIVPSQAGKGVSGNEMALQKNENPAFISETKAVIRYVLGTSVPHNWTPFIPVHIEGSDREIKLQRAKMPDAKGPFGILVKEQKAPYFINEEEIPRSGVIIKRTFQRARWINGKTFLWIGRSKLAGKGEGWSNLKFDQLEDITQKNE